MAGIRSAFLTLCLMGFTGVAGAQTLTFSNVSGEDMKNITGEVSTNFMHTTVSGASSLGHLFGFELGVIAGTTRTPKIDAIAKEGSSSASADQALDAALIGAVSVPFGITGEIGLVPKVGSQDFKFNTYSLGVKWTPTDLFWDLPVNVAVKGSITRTHVESSQTISGTPTSLKFDDTQEALTFLVSKSFVIVEPYFGLGMARAKGDLDVSGFNVFDPSFTTATSASGKTSSALWTVGAEFKLVFLKLGVEYMHAFDTSRVAGKLSFYF
jgi:hypothetical protein